jgi:hypothetical protein
MEKQAKSKHSSLFGKIVIYEFLTKAHTWLYLQSVAKFTKARIMIMVTLLSQSLLFIKPVSEHNILDKSSYLAPASSMTKFTKARNMIKAHTWLQLQV